MNVKMACILIAGSLLASCSSGNVIEHLTLAEKHSMKDQGEICIIRAEAIDPSGWKRIAESAAYMNRIHKGTVSRFPRLPFFHLIVKNTSPLPIRIEKIHLIYGNTLAEPMTAQEFRSKYRSAAYEPINVQGLFSYRLLTAEKLSIKEIDFDRDTAAFHEERIPPGRTALKVLAFDWVPVQHRRFILRLTVTGEASKKIIDLKLIRYEYRPGEKFFSEPEEKESK